MVNPTPAAHSTSDNARVPDLSSRTAAWVLTAVGAASLGAVVTISVSTGRFDPLAPSLLAASFLLAGVIGTRARRDHPGMLLMSAVGASHLFAFATAAWVADARGVSAWSAWSVALAGDWAFGAGFLCLGLLLATYPDGVVSTPAQGWLRCVGTAWVLTAVLVEAASSRAELALDGYARRPWSTPSLDAHLLGTTPLLVVLGAVVLALRARRATGPEAAAMGWAKLAGAIVALLLLATPAATVLLPAAGWGAVFIGTAAVLPFVLLAGLSHHRLLEVDVYIARTLARGALALVIVSGYAVAVSVAARHVVLVAVVLTLLAVVAAGPALAALERLADRWVTRGRVGQKAILRNILDTVASRSPEESTAWLTRAIREGLDVSGVRLCVDGRVLAASGDVRKVRESVPLQVGGVEVATLECGPRRGGWGRTHRQTLHAAAPAVALAVREAGLTDELRRRIEELHRSRARLVHAEDTARRRVERDLHDGAQQQLVALLAMIGIAATMTERGSPAFDPLDKARELAADALRDLRTLVTGIYPPVLVDRGLVAAVEARADLMPVEVRVEADDALRRARLGADVEGAAYFVVSEALTNVLKHAGVTRARVALDLEGGRLRVRVTDEGSGTVGLDGSGLTGLRDRVHALDGELTVEGRPGAGTTVTACLPVTRRDST